MLPTGTWNGCVPPLESKFEFLIIFFGPAVPSIAVSMPSITGRAP
jgi:hypothetical protein